MNLKIIFLSKKSQSPLKKKKDLFTQDSRKYESVLIADQYPEEGRK